MLRLTLREQLLSKVLVLGLLTAACSSDDSGKKGTTEDPANAGDGDKGDGDTGDGDGDKGDAGKIDVPPVKDPITEDSGTPPAGCAQGTTRECSCEDGTTKGTQLCIQGMFLEECSGCPCKEGDVQACFCEGGGVGSAQCEEPNFGACECVGGGDGGAGPGPCPDGFMCQEVGGMGLGGMGAICLPGGIPPTCATNAECVTKGLPDATCSEIPMFGIKLCVQPCTPAPATP